MAKDRERHEFTPDSMDEIAQMVRQTRAELRDLREFAQGIRRGGGGGLELLPARTTTNDDNPDYPETGATFVCELERWRHSETVGAVGRDASTPRGVYRIAQQIAGEWIPQDSPVLLIALPSISGRQWWIIGGPFFEDLDSIADVWDNTSELKQLVQLTRSPILPSRDIVAEVIAEFVDCEPDSGSSGETPEGAYEIVESYSHASGEATLVWTHPTSWYSGGGGGGSQYPQYRDNLGAWKTLPLANYYNGDGFSWGSNIYTDPNVGIGWRVHEPLPSDVETPGQLTVRIITENATGNFQPPSDPIYTDEHTITLFDGSTACADFHEEDPNYCG